MFRVLITTWIEDSGQQSKSAAVCTVVAVFQSKTEADLAIQAVTDNCYKGEYNLKQRAIALYTE